MIKKPKNNNILIEAQNEIVIIMNEIVLLTGLDILITATEILGMLSIDITALAQLSKEGKCHFD